jgi:hypothetical protein
MSDATKIVPRAEESKTEGNRNRLDSTDSTDSTDAVEDPFEIMADPTDGPKLYTQPEYLKAPSEKVSTKTLIRLFCEEPHSSKHATYFHGCYSIIIIASVAAYCMETLNLKGGPEGVNNLTVQQYKVLEIIFTIIFSLDIIIRCLVTKRICCCECGAKTKGYDETATPFFLDIMVIFDILSVLPYPIGEIIDVTGLGLALPWLGSSLRVLSLCRILRVFKVTRNFDGAKVLFVTTRNSMKPLMVSFIVLISVMVIVSAALFFFEPCYNSDCVFTDQANAAYFLVITLTTIGYGDQIPVTNPGKTIAMGIAFLGSFYMAMPLAIIGSKFDEAYKERELALAEHSKHRADQLKEALSHVSNKDRRQRVLRLGFKITEVLNNSINASETENRFYMKAFPRKADIMCNDISILFEVALRGTKLDRSNSLKRTASMIKQAQKTSSKKKRKNTTENIRTQMMVAVKTMANAKESKKCRDKVWLVMNETGPNASKASKWFSKIQMFVVGLSILVVGIETTPEFNMYGPTTRICKQVVSYYCNKYVDPNNPEHVAANPGCFPMDVEVNGKKEHYGGCIVSDNQYEKSCDFPNVKAAMTCVSELNQTTTTLPETLMNDSGVARYSSSIRTETFGVIYHESSVHNSETMVATTPVTLMFKNGTIIKKQPMNSPIIAFDPSFSDWINWDHKIHDPVSPMCGRTQCINNDMTNTNYPLYFFLSEAVFIFFFTIEILVRLFVMRSCSQFWLNFANVIDIAAALVALAEIVWIPLSWGAPAYEVWGMGSFMDPAVFRVTRILVAVRFISLQRQNGGLSVISETLSKTWSKLVIPIVFFVLFTLLFAGIFYTFESGSLFSCPDDLREQLSNGFVHRKYIEKNHPDKIGRCHACLPKLPSGVSVEELREAGQIVNPYDGTCELITVRGDDQMSVTMIKDMFDSIWLMVITMTTVGYGGKYPRTMTGKVVAICSAVFGSLYMAMPLTIVGNKFYDIFLQHEQEKIKAQYNSQRLAHEKRKSLLAEQKKNQHSSKRLEEVEDLKLRHVITLKRWVYRTKRKLEVQALAPDERIAIRKYLKECRKLCTLKTFKKKELSDFRDMHTTLMGIVSKHLIHRHAEGIDMFEATLY